MTGTGLAAFDALCRCGNDLERLRESCHAGSDAWTALTQLVQAVDRVIDALVHSGGLEDDNEEDP